MAVNIDYTEIINKANEIIIVANNAISNFNNLISSINKKIVFFTNTITNPINNMIFFTKYSNKIKNDLDRLEIIKLDIYSIGKSVIKHVKNKYCEASKVFMSVYNTFIQVHNILENDEIIAIYNKLVNHANEAKVDYHNGIKCTDCFLNDCYNCDYFRYSESICCCDCIINKLF